MLAHAASAAGAPAPRIDPPPMHAEPQMPGVTPQWSPLGLFCGIFLGAASLWAYYLCHEKAQKPEYRGTPEAKEGRDKCALTTTGGLAGLGLACAVL